MNEPRGGARSTRAARLTWGVIAVSIALQLAGAVMDNIQGSSDEASILEGIAMSIAFATFPIVGGILASRGQRHALTRTMIGIGVVAGLGVFSMGYAQRALVLHAGSLPGGTVAAWIEAWFWLPLLELIVLFLIMFFPDGRLVSPRWRPLFWSACALFVVSTLAPMFQERLVTDSYNIDNPIGIAGIGDAETAMGPLLILLAMCGVGALASLIVRFRRSQGDERMQMKWFTWAAGFLVSGVLVGDLLGLPDYVFALVVVSLPLSMGVAILKYRLYEIDVIINRALVYGSLTGLAVVLYLGLVFALQIVLEPMTEGSELAVAGSTLAVAALVRPLRSWIQGFIDRRFYRRKYNASQALATFTTRLRNEVDLTVVEAGVLGVLNDTIQPKHASVWLRTDGVSR